MFFFRSFTPKNRDTICLFLILPFYYFPFKEILLNKTLHIPIFLRTRFLEDDGDLYTSWSRTLRVVLPRLKGKKLTQSSTEEAPGLANHTIS